MSGGPPSEVAVARALLWLARHQDEDGSWTTAARDVAPPFAWVGFGVTSLALLAFLGAGHSHQRADDPYARTVERGVVYLLQRQDSQGGLLGVKRGRYMYNHAIGTLALVEAYAVSRDPRLRAPANQALKYLAVAQNPERAWRYAERDGDNDLSVTGWCLDAVRAGRLAGLEGAATPAVTRAAMAWIDSLSIEDIACTGYKDRPPSGWAEPTSARLDGERSASNLVVGIQRVAIPPRAGDPAPPPPPSVLSGPNPASTYASNHTPTAIAVYLRCVLAEQGQTAGSNVRALRLIAKCPPTRGSPARSAVDFCYWYHGTQAMFHARAPQLSAWSKTVVTLLLESQSIQAGDTGSWDPIDAWGTVGGRVYSTAINTLTLQTGYRYARPQPR